MITSREARNAIGTFYLGVSAVIGAYIIIFAETRALPISADDANGAFKIIIPTFLAQLTLIFKWFAGSSVDSQSELRLPRWVVYGPLFCVMIILVTTIVVIVVDGGDELKAGLIFQNAVTFAVSIVGATTVFISMTLFQVKPEEKASN